jgi:hypothetical protein
LFNGLKEINYKITNQTFLWINGKFQNPKYYSKKNQR